MPCFHWHGWFCSLSLMRHTFFAEQQRSKKYAHLNQESQPAKLPRLLVDCNLISLFKQPEIRGSNLRSLFINLQPEKSFCIRRRSMEWRGSCSRQQNVRQPSRCTVCTHLCSACSHCVHSTQTRLQCCTANKPASESFFDFNQKKDLLQHFVGRDRLPDDQTLHNILKSNNF